MGAAQDRIRQQFAVPQVRQLRSKCPAKPLFNATRDQSAFPESVPEVVVGSRDLEKKSLWQRSVQGQAGSDQESPKRPANHIFHLSSGSAVMRLS